MTLIEELYARGVESLEGVEEHWLDPRNPSDVTEVAERMVATAHRYVETLSRAVEQERDGFLFDAEASVEQAHGIATSAEYIAAEFFEVSLACAARGQDVWLGGESLIESLGGSGLGF